MSTSVVLMRGGPPCGMPYWRSLLPGLSPKTAMREATKREPLPASPKSEAPGMPARQRAAPLPGGELADTRPIRTTATASPVRRGCLILLALGLLACAPPAPAEITGHYRHEGQIAATLEVRDDGDQHVVRLEGGGLEAAGAASAADCIIEARGRLDGTILQAGFGPVETDSFVYAAAQAASEGRIVEIVFEPGVAIVREADTFGYCGLDAALIGRYRKER